MHVKLQTAVILFFLIFSIAALFKEKNSNESQTRGI
jgi:hypothetical protein